MDGGPDVVIEIRSPGDETCRKLDFYASVGVSEVVALGRDTHRVEVFVLSRGRYERRIPRRGGRLDVAALRARFRSRRDRGADVVEIFLELDGVAAKA